MPYRLTTLYTRKGDDGYTTFGKKRLAKDEFLIETIGNLDELNSFIGFIISLKIKHQEIEAILTQIQNDLFDFGGELYLLIASRKGESHPSTITAKKVLGLEEKIDEWNSQLPPLKEFLLPRGNPKSAATHIARTVCRRAERSLVKLHHQIHLPNSQLLAYLNRLSDLLFVIARTVALETGEKEQLWIHETNSSL